MTDTELTTKNSTTDGLAASRRYVLVYNYLSGIVGTLASGTYFVGLMLAMGAPESYIAAITAITTICSFAQFFSPLVLERMKKRKTFLITFRALYHLLNVLVIGILPLLPMERSVSLGIFMATAILANLFKFLSLSGISIWHMQNVPQEKHSDFFTRINVGHSVLNTAAGFVAGRLVDYFRNHSVTRFEIDPQMLAFLVIRAAALLLALTELYCLAGIKEHPYAQSGAKRVDLRTLFVPLKNRPFLRVIMIYVIYSFIAGLIGNYFQVYLLEIVDMSYTMISLSGVLSLPLVLLLSPAWSYLLRKFSWRRVMPVALTGVALGYFFNTLITESTQIFHIVCCVIYASFYVAVGIIFAFLPYVNMPQTNRTSYISFFTISGSVAGLLGHLAGMLFMRLASGLEYTLFGLKITSYQSLNLLQTVGFLLLALYSVYAARKEKGNAPSGEEVR